MMQFFTDLFGPSFGPTAAYIALLLLIVLIALAAWFAYRAFNRPRLASGKRSRQTRLAITDVALVDKHRRLVLLRRDDVEHLIMIGGHGDLVIEKDIRRNAPARPLAVPEGKPAATATSSKKAEPKKQVPPQPQSQTPAASTPPPKPESKPLPPLKLQEEVPSPNKTVSPGPASAPPTATSSYTPHKIAAATGALAASASAIKSDVSDAATSVKSTLAMPVAAKPTIQEEKKPAEAETKSVEAEAMPAQTPSNPDPDPAALKEMDALLEELAVPKK